ncbi:phosphatidylinositol kinase- protein kinase tor1, partial [Cladochytrium tenue]
VVVRIQMLAELEEIIKYKQFNEYPEGREVIKKTWAARLNGCQRNVDMWQRILRVRALVVPPKEDIGTWIKFANLCRKSNRPGLSFRTLSGLLTTESRDLDVLDMKNNPPQVVYACLKHAWASWATGGKAVREHAYVQMREFTVSLVERLGIHSAEDISFQIENSRGDEARMSLFKLLARCYLKIGEWENALQDELSEGNSLQDTLRLLTLWFKYGHQKEVTDAIAEGFGTTNIDVWLQVIPQLIARIHAPSLHVRNLIHKLLIDIGKAHPQALVYSLTVASKSQSEARKDAAVLIIEQMRSHSSILVEQVCVITFAHSLSPRSSVYRTNI